MNPLGRHTLALDTLMHRFAFLALCALAGCSSSHSTDECDGAAPDCYFQPVGRRCCVEGLVRATCSDGVWTCGASRSLAEGCEAIDICAADHDGGPPPPPPIDYYACSLTSDCTLASTTCCGTCGRPTLADFAAINATYREDYYYDVACPEARTEPPPCPGCATMPNPNLRATCSAGRCAGIDVETDPDLSSCSVDADCVIRVPDCCDCGADTSPYNLIALRADAVSDYLSAVCDPAEACDGCIPTYPAEAQAVCMSGSCRVVIGAP